MLTPIDLGCHFGRAIGNVERVTSSGSTLWPRVLLALLALVAATFVLWPDPAKPRAVTWEDLVLPLVPGGLVTRGYTLSPPRRGEERDVIFTARRDDPKLGPPGRIEVHVVDKGQWPGIRETASFGVAYESPRSNAPIEDLEAVTETIATHLRANDHGLANVSNIPLEAEPSPPWISRALERMTGLRAGLVVLLVVMALGFVTSLPRGGDVSAAVLLFCLGLGLRLPHLDLPFTHDQDVQRLFTGQLPLSEILTGKGLQDRHPPLWFVVLHVAGLFGQTETIARLPAVLAGALIGPAIIWGSRLVRGRAGPAGALCGLVVTISPELVARSREVSEIPFFALLVIAAMTLATRLSSSASTRLKRWLAIVTALLAWTYYLAPLVILGMVLSLGVARRLRRDVLVALGIGSLAGAPAYLLGAWMTVRDHGAREVAATFPHLAWGQRSSLETMSQLATQATNSVGTAIICAAIVAAFLAMAVRRDPAPFVAFGVTITTAVGIALASNIARVQPYYLVAIVPALVLAVALGPSTRSRAGPVWLLVCASSLLMFGHASLRGAGLTYVPDSDAFMPRFASFALRRPEPRIVVVAHYDATLLAYYIEQTAGGDAMWPDVEQSGEFVLRASERRVLPLAHSHALVEGSGIEARTGLHRALEQGPVLVIERDAFVLTEVHDELARCDELLTAPAARLLRCPAALPSGRSGAR